MQKKVLIGMKGKRRDFCLLARRDRRIQRVLLFKLAEEGEKEWHLYKLRGLLLPASSGANWIT